jgi:tetratricopeptide (TPR) repeat protein
MRVSKPRAVVAALLCALLATCGNPLKGKNPNWYNGYVYGTRGYTLFAQGKLEPAILSYQKALAEASRFDIPQQVALYTFNIARCFSELDKYDSALTYFQRSYTGFVFCSDGADSRRCAGFIALTFSSMGGGDSALAWYKHATAVTADKKERPFWLSVHGRLLWRRDHGKEALDYFEEAFDLYKKQKAYNAMAQMCSMRAEIYRWYADYPEAKKCIEEALFWGDKSVLRYDRFRMVLAAAAICACLNDREGVAWYYQRACACAPSGMPVPPFEKIKECGKTLQ